MGLIWGRGHMCECVQRVERDRRCFPEDRWANVLLEPMEDLDMSAKLRMQSQDTHIANQDTCSQDFSKHH